jgi:hypothetical protein
MKLLKSKRDFAFKPCKLFLRSYINYFSNSIMVLGNSSMPQYYILYVGDSSAYPNNLISFESQNCKNFGALKLILIIEKNISMLDGYR